jgi:hypothetical protein
MIGISVNEDHVGSRLALLKDTLARIEKFKDETVRVPHEVRLVRAIDVLSEMQTEATAIRTDPHLSEKGQAERFRASAKATLLKLRFFFEAAKSAEQEYLKSRAALYQVPKAPEGRSELDDLLRAQEVRTWLRSLPLSSRMFAYLSAVQRGDVEIVRAVRTTPGEPLLALEFIERVARDAAPEDSRTHVENLDLLRQELADLSNMLKNWLDGYEEPKFSTPGRTPLPASAAAR